jgi:hypothetical protein
MIYLLLKSIYAFFIKCKIRTNIKRRQAAFSTSSTYRTNTPLIIMRRGIDIGRDLLRVYGSAVRHQQRPDGYGFVHVRVEPEFPLCGLDDDRHTVVDGCIARLASVVMMAEPVIVSPVAGSSHSS